MRDWTYTELKNKVVNDLDLANETEISAQEWLDYFNEAIDEAEAEIHNAGVEAEYFLDSATISLVSGTSSYALPSTIYATKIKEMVYNNGTDIFTIHRVRGQNRFTQLAEIDTFESGGSPFYQYILTNASGVGPRIRLTPAVQETAANVITLWFIRNAKQLTTGSDVLDIPEFANFIISYVKCRILQKDGDARIEVEAAALSQQRTLMVDTLAEMVPDEDNTIPPDLSHYEEHE